MELNDFLLALITALVTAEIGSTHFRLARIEREISGKADRGEVGSILEELRKKPDRGEFELFRNDVAGLRADLTQIALAVGAERPRKVE